MKALIFDISRERITSLRNEIRRLQNKEYSSPASGKVLGIVKAATEILTSVLSEYENNKKEDLKYLDESEIELVLKRFTILIPYLYYYLSFIRGSEIENTPVELILPLRRKVREYISQSEIIFVAEPEFNFSFLEIAKPFRDMFSEFSEFGELCENMPKFLLWISLPSAESNNGLLLTTIAHEIGHGIYREREIKDALIPLITIDKDKITKLSKELYAILQSEEELLTSVPSELSLREALSKDINSILDDWMEELASDAIGLYLFGPAYLFAFIHLSLPIQMIDQYSHVHPSSRMRLKALTICMQVAGYDKTMSEKILAIYSKWAEYSNKEIISDNPLYNTAIDIILPNLNRFCDVIKGTINDLLYPTDKYSGIHELVERLICLIPANEAYNPTKKDYEAVDIISALNAGWEVLLTRLSELCKNLQTEKLSIGKEKLNELILSSIDKIEIKRKWSETKKP